MGFFNFWKPSAPKKQTLSDFSMDDLNRERIGCQQELAKQEREQAKLLKDEQQLKNEYASATNELQKKSIARRVQDCRTQQRQVDTWITRVNQNLRIVNNFIMIKKDQAFYERAGVLSMLNQMDAVEIEQFISKVALDGSLNRDKLVEVLQAQENGLADLFPAESDHSLDALMSELDAETAPMRDMQMGANADAGIQRVEADMRNQADDGIRSIDQMLEG